MSKRNTLTLLICTRQTCRHHDAAARSRCRLFPGLSVSECRTACLRRVPNPDAQKSKGDAGTAGFSGRNGER